MKRVYFVKDDVNQKVYTREGILRYAPADCKFELRLKDSMSDYIYYAGNDFDEVLNEIDAADGWGEWLVTIEQLDTNGLFAMCGIYNVSEVVTITAWDVNG